MTIMTQQPAQPKPTGQQAPGQGGQVAARPYPFPVGVYESGVQDYQASPVLGATIAAWTSPVQAPIWNISPTGWMRGVWIDFTYTVAGNAATVAFGGDGPFSGVQNVTLFDLGGEVIQQLIGYEWMIMNKFGGYFGTNDPRADLTFSVTTGSGASGGSSHFILYLPLEAVSRDSLGVVQNESKPGWKIQVNLDTAANYIGSGGTQPTATGTVALSILGFIDSYTEPAAAAPGGRQFAQTPPLPGSLQYWKDESQAMPSGTSKYDLTNGIGFAMRNILYYGRDAGNSTRATADGNWPSPLTFLVGNVNYFTRTKNLWIAKMFRVFTLGAVGATFPAADTAAGRENAVFPVWFTQDFDGNAGMELRYKYLDTQVNTLVRVTGSFGATMTLNAVTNWLATPSQNRYALIGG